MGLSRQEQFRYWGIVALLFVLLVWGMGYALLPFLLGGGDCIFS